MDFSKLSFIKRTLYQSPYFIHSMILLILFMESTNTHFLLHFWFSSVSHIQALGVPRFCFLSV